MRPIGRKIFAEKIISENKTSSGLIIPGSVKRENKYKVLCVGERTKLVKVGDVVKKYHGAIVPSIEYDGKIVEILSEDQHIEFVY